MLLDSRLFLAGDPLTVDLFYRASSQWTRRTFDDPVVIESIVQQALLEMTARLQSGETPAREQLAFWIYGCTNNVVRRELRRRGKIDVVTYESGVHGYEPIDIEQATALRLELEQLELKLELLSDRARALLTARIRGETYREVAKLFGMNEGAARETISSLRKRLVGDLTARDKAEYLMRWARKAGLDDHSRPSPDESTSS